MMKVDRGKMPRRGPYWGEPDVSHGDFELTDDVDVQRSAFDAG
jgi:hypothetical protein